MISVGTATQLAEDLYGHTTASVLQPSTHPEHPEEHKKRLRSLIESPFPRPLRAELERACRIALMETEEPVSVERARNCGALADGRCCSEDTVTRGAATLEATVTAYAFIAAK